MKASRCYFCTEFFSKLLGGGTLFLGQLMASSLPSGSVSILNYGTRLSGILLALGPTALAVAILPRFSRLAADDDWTALRRALIRILGVSLAAGSAIGAALFYFSGSIIRLTLQRGAFTSADTGAVATVQAISMLQLPFLVGTSILARTLSAMKANQVVFPVFGIGLIVTAVLSIPLMSRYQTAGIASAACIGQTAAFLMLLGMVFRTGRARYPTERRS